MDGREPDTGSAELAGGMESLKRCKEFIVIGHIKPYPVISNVKNAFSVLDMASHFDGRRVPRLRVFDRVGKKVDKHLADHRPVTVGAGRIIQLQRDLPARNHGLE